MTVKSPSGKGEGSAVLGVKVTGLIPFVIPARICSASRIHSDKDYFAVNVFKPDVSCRRAAAAYPATFAVSVPCPSIEDSAVVVITGCIKDNGFVGNGIGGIALAGAACPAQLEAAVAVILEGKGDFACREHQLV